MITDNEPIEKETNERSTFEILIPGQPKLITAEGLGAAFLLDTIALSFLSGDFWKIKYKVPGRNVTTISFFLNS